MTQPTDRPWLNPGSDPVSQRAYALIFNGLCTGLLKADVFVKLSDREQIAETIYESLRTGGIEVRLGDGLAKLREVAAEVKP